MQQSSLVGVPTFGGKGGARFRGNLHLLHRRLRMQLEKKQPLTTAALHLLAVF